MVGEFSFYGIFVPWLLLQVILTFALSWMLRRGLALSGFYRWVWHPPLFDTALFIILLFIVAKLFFLFLN